MRLDFSRQAFIEAAIHVLAMAITASVSGCANPEIRDDSPPNTVKNLA